MQEISRKSKLFYFSSPPVFSWITRYVLVKIGGRYIPEVFIYLLSVISLAFEIDERPKRIFPSFKLAKLKFGKISEKFFFWNFFLKFFSDIESEEKLSLEKPTPSGLIFTAIRIVQQASKEKFNFAAASEIYEDFTIISELPLEDDLKVCTLKA